MWRVSMIGMTIEIIDNLLSYHDRLATRPVEAIDLIVIHCTELPSLALAREYGERELYPSATGNSGHYYVDRDGRCERYVPLTSVAHHTRGFNARSIGIELVNTGRYPHWEHSEHQQMSEPYSDIQIDVLRNLLAHLEHRLVGLRYIAGHEELDLTRVPASDNPTVRVRRKLDPGPLFPWPDVVTGSRLVHGNPPNSTDSHD